MRGYFDNFPFPQLTESLLLNLWQAVNHGCGQSCVVKLNAPKVRGKFCQLVLQQVRDEEDLLPVLVSELVQAVLAYLVSCRRWVEVLFLFF